MMYWPSPTSIEPCINNCQSMTKSPWKLEDHLHGIEKNIIDVHKHVHKNEIWLCNHPLYFMEDS
jgi:hypothetical protein